MLQCRDNAAFAGTSVPKSGRVTTGKLGILIGRRTGAARSCGAWVRNPTHLTKRPRAVPLGESAESSESPGSHLGCRRCVWRPGRRSGLPDQGRRPAFTVGSNGASRASTLLCKPPILPSTWQNASSCRVGARSSTPAQGTASPGEELLAKVSVKTDPRRDKAARP